MSPHRYRNFPYSDYICWELYTFYLRHPDGSCKEAGFVGVIRDRTFDPTDSTS